MSAALEGQLEIIIDWRDGVVQDVHIASSRPVGLSRAFAGKPVDEVLEHLPRLYSLCGVAQGVAARLAADAARGLATDAATQRAMGAAVLAETAQEHLWRLLLDWPMLLWNEAPDPRCLREVRGLLPALMAQLAEGGQVHRLSGERLSAAGPAVRETARRLDAWLSDWLFGMPAVDWLELDAAAAARWEADSSEQAARLLRAVRESDPGISGGGFEPLPVLKAEAVDARLHADAAGFVAKPDWEGVPRETTPLQRQSGHARVAAAVSGQGSGVYTRLTALLVELAMLPGRLDTLCAPEVDAMPALLQGSAVGEDAGIAQVEAARGRLIHRVAVRDGRVDTYQIVAPTEWNFHPEGALWQGLSGLRAADAEALRRQAALWITAIDPCVQYQLEIRHDA
ncbi:MAG: nickel-dependent hydrogenase large subunit [Gammaproteobacteria bacterium]